MSDQRQRDLQDLCSRACAEEDAEKLRDLLERIFEILEAQKQNSPY